MTTNVTGWNPMGTLVEGADGSLYGTTSKGQGALAGTVFKVDKDGTGFCVLKFFTNALEGASPQCSLVRSGGVLYGTTLSGGSSGLGTVFRLNTDGTGYAVLKSFSGSDGASPYAGLMLSGAVLYGTTYSGGSSNKGTVFRLNSDGTDFAVLANFTTTNGANPSGTLTLSEGTLYGTTYFGGSYGLGTVFKVNTDGAALQILHDFSGPEGRNPQAGLVLSGQTLYGTTYAGGNASGGTVFSLTTDGLTHTVLYHFSGFDGQRPYAGLALSGNTLFGTTRYGGSTYTGTSSSGSGSVFSVNIDGTAFNTLKSFSDDGKLPCAGLLLSGNVVYGTTYSGGDSACGLVYALGTDGSGYTVLKRMNGMDGETPYGQLLVLGSTLYGTTYSGGNSNGGTVFKIGNSGLGYTVLKNLGATNGVNPFAGLAASGSALYGTASSGGIAGNYGTIFKLNTNGDEFAVLKYLDSTTGTKPRAGLLVANDMLYGTAPERGGSAYGTVYRLRTNGLNFSVFKTFVGGSDGSSPIAGLTLSGSTLYGSSRGGGDNNWGTVFRLDTNGGNFGVVWQSFDSKRGEGPYTLLGDFLYGTDSFQNSGHLFKVHTNGSAFTNYCSLAGGSNFLPRPGLLLVGTTFYGVTVSGGTSNLGTVFQVNADGSGYTILKDFTGADGANPCAGLARSGNALYGTTSSGGAFNVGAVYRIDLPPLLKAEHNGSTLALSWEAAEGATSQVQYSSSLSGGDWMDLGNPLIMTNSTATLFDPVGPEPRRFYRVRIH